MERVPLHGQVGYGLPIVSVEERVGSRPDTVEEYESFFVPSAAHPYAGRGWEMNSPERIVDLFKTAAELKAERSKGYGQAELANFEALPSFLRWLLKLAGWKERCIYSTSDVIEEIEYDCKALAQWTEDNRERESFTPSEMIHYCDKPRIVARLLVPHPVGEVIEPLEDAG